MGQIEKIEQVIYDYVDSKQTERVYLCSSHVNELAKPFVHNAGLAEALYNAGYRKVPFGSVILTPEQRDEEMKACNEKQAELEAEIEHLKLENQAASDSADTLIAEQDKFAKEQRRLAVKEFASKLKDKAIDFLYSAAVDGHPGFDINISELCHMIDELLKEYER